MTREEAFRLAAQLQSAINAHDIPAIMNCYTDDATMKSPVFDAIHGSAAIAKTWETIFATFPDWQVNIADVLIDGNRVAFMGSNSTVDRTGWFGLPPTGAPITYRAVILLTFSGEKIIRDERVYDLGAVLEHIEKARIDQELKAASEVQRILLPRTARKGRFYEAVGGSLPCRAIGGDFFEFIDLPSGDFAVALGDISGKGPAAALLASLLQGMLISEARLSSSPSKILSAENHLLLGRSLGEQFASLFYGILTPKGQFDYCNGGHNPPLALTANGISRLTCGGPVLGLFNDAVFNDGSLQLHSGDSVILFSDGVTEARNPRDEEFGEDRLLACVKPLHDRAPAEIAGAIGTAVREFCEGAPQTDDVTIAVIRFN